jgi:hypothetical protein
VNNEREIVVNPPPTFFLLIFDSVSDSLVPFAFFNPFNSGLSGGLVIECGQKCYFVFLYLQLDYLLYILTGKHKNKQKRINKLKKKKNPTGSNLSAQNFLIAILGMEKNIIIIVSNIGLVHMKL